MTDTIYTFRSVSPRGNQKLRKIRAPSFELAFEKALTKFRHIKYFKYTMDLLTAIKRAQDASKTTKKPYYISVDEQDGECSIGTAPIGHVTHKFVNGEEDKSFTERHKEKVKKEATDEALNETIKTNKKMSTKKEVKKVAAKPAKKEAVKKVSPAKKAPAKKTAEKKAKKGKYTEGKVVTMTNKEMSAKIKKGFMYFNEKGVNKTNYIPERPDQDQVNKGYYEVAPK